FHFSVTLGAILGFIIIALVISLKMGREYRLTPRGVTLVWRWPSPRQQEITWNNLGDVLLRRGLTQTILRVGNLIIKDKSGGPEMFWFGLANPKEIQAEIERRRS
ncbi:MAG: PH domain-containing protein, partial [Deltaproteobacteria bacterium]|nr:PH domain-containing protein [Deltaproteobacteria bacterium]